MADTVAELDEEAAARWQRYRAIELAGIRAERPRRVKPPRAAGEPANIAQLAEHWGIARSSAAKRLEHLASAVISRKPWRIDVALADRLLAERAAAARAAASPTLHVVPPAEPTAELEPQMGVQPNFLEQSQAKVLIGAIASIKPALDRLGLTPTADQQERIAVAVARLITPMVADAAIALDDPELETRFSALLERACYLAITAALLVLEDSPRQPRGFRCGFRCGERPN